MKQPLSRVDKSPSRSRNVATSVGQLLHLDKIKDSKFLSTVREERETTGVRSVVTRRL